LLQPPDGVVAEHQALGTAPQLGPGRPGQLLGRPAVLADAAQAQQVLGILLFERNAGHRPAVHHGCLGVTLVLGPQPHEQGHRLQVIPVGGGQRVQHQLLVGLGVVAVGRGLAPLDVPQVQHPAVVVAHHAQGAALARQGHHAGRVRPLGHDVPHQHQPIAALPAGALRAQQGLELVDAAVHVPDDDGPLHVQRSA
jgi:hypothetical protein